MHTTSGVQPGGASAGLISLYIAIGTETNKMGQKVLLTPSGLKDRDERREPVTCKDVRDPKLSTCEDILQLDILLFNKICLMKSQESNLYMMNTDKKNQVDSTSFLLLL